eukprot:c7764_g1_i1 orf=261-1622(-)
MTAHAKYPGAYSPLGYEVKGESEWGKILTQKKLLCLCVFVPLLPFAVAQLFFYYADFQQASMAPPEEFENLFSNQFNHSSSDKFSSINKVKHKDQTTTGSITLNTSVGSCNIWKGDWIPDSLGPLYTNKSCYFIQEHQNCLKNGRPDHGYLYWRWRPTDCVLPRFDSVAFLKLVQGKAFAFIGDSIARNHFQSILCSLAQAEIPQNLYRDANDQNVRWFFPSYNFTLAIVWSPYLVQGTEEELKGIPKGTLKMFLDVVDSSWMSSVDTFDYIVLSSGQWYFKSAVYLMKDKVVGCHYCPGLNLAEKGFFFAFRAALRTAFDFVVSSNFKGIAFFRTFTPDHFENGRWDTGGNCLKTVPYSSYNTPMEGVTSEMYNIQLEEFGRTLKMNAGIESRWKLADTIHASLLRPDGHPGAYRNFQPDDIAKVQNDCLHWCLPGPIDSWNEMLLEMLIHL